MTVIPVAQAGAKQEWSFSSLPKTVTLEGAASFSPVAWEWRMLSVPPTSSADVGVNGDFINGVSTLQNPSFVCDVQGCYVMQLRARNAAGWSDPLLDRELAQTPVYILTSDGIHLPGAFLWRFDEDLNQSLLDLASMAGGSPPAIDPVNITKATASAGSGTTPARHDHKHDVSTAIAVAIGLSLSEGAASTLARSDHVHTATLLSLLDAPHSYTGQGGKFLKVNVGETGVEFGAGAAGISFTDLLDVPGSYSGQAGKMVVVNPGETALAFATPAGTDANAIHVNVSGEISGLTDKASPVAADLFVIEDSEALNVKKKIQFGALPLATSSTRGLVPAFPADPPTEYVLKVGQTWGYPYDGSAIHGSVAGEINALTEKTTPVGNDLIIIEDSESTSPVNQKKKVKLSNLPGGGMTLLGYSNVQYDEGGTADVTEVQFGVVSSSSHPFSGFHVVIGLWHDTATSCDCTVRVGTTEGSGGDTVALSSTSTSQEIKVGDITFTQSNNTEYTCWVRIRRTGGSGNVHMKYLAVYGVFA